MPLPIITNVFQAVLVWNNAFAQRPATTTLHFIRTDNADTAADLYASLDSSVTAGMWNALSDAARVDHVDITPLDGASAASTFNTGSPDKWKGASGTDFIPQGCIVISIKSGQRGSRGRNRVFLPWVSETQQQSGTIAAMTLATMTTGWTGFHGSMNDLGWPMVAASGKFSDSHLANVPVVRGFLKTQRRRARR